MLTVKNTQQEIQAAVDQGGVVEFAPGIYENAHYRITKPVHLIGNGAVLVGGRRIVWQRTQEGLLCCEVKAAKPLRSLVVNGGLRNRCRFPAEGYLQHESVFEPGWQGTNFGGWERKPTHRELTTLKVKKGDLEGLTLYSAEITVVHSWDESLVKIADFQGQEITMEQETIHPVGGFGKKNYCLWNIPQALTEAGTFYHDIEAGRLYYKPLPGEDESTAAYLPEYESIFYTEGPIADVEMEGFTLMCTEPDHVKAGFGACLLTGAVELGENENVKLHDLNITAVGGHGIRTTGKCNGMQIKRCHLYGLGAGGFTGGSGKDEGKSEISDCHVHHVGLYYASAIGIRTTNFHVRHNEVHHTSYSAVVTGGKDYIIEKNLIYDCMIVLNDGAAFFSGESHRGILRNNLVYGIQPKAGHRLRIAYYLDELSRYWTVEHNVALECNFPNHNHMCGDHLYRENIFVNSRADLYFDMQDTNWPCSYERNVFSAGGEITVRMAEDGMERFAENCYHSVSGVIQHSILKEGLIVGEKPLQIDAGNQLIEAVSFDKDQRVFTVGDLTIDLRDVGPRK